MIDTDDIKQVNDIKTMWDKHMTNGFRPATGPFGVKLLSFWDRLLLHKERHSVQIKLWHYNKYTQTDEQSNKWVTTERQR